VKEYRETPDAFMGGVRRVRSLVRKEFIQIVRNRQNFGLLLIAPLLQVFLFGSASRMDVDNVATVVADLDRSALSREVIDAFSGSGYFKIVARTDSYDEVDGYFDRSEAAVALLVPPDLERRVKANRTATVGVLLDGVDTIVAGTVSGYAQTILQRLSKDILLSRTGLMQGVLFKTNNPRLLVPEVTVSGRAWFNENLYSKNFFVPGVVALIMLAMSIVVTSAIIVREKEIGTLEQLMVTPVSRLELILGKLIPSFIIEIVALCVVAPLAFLVFRVPFRGSLLFYAATFILFLITSSGIGVTISTFCRTQQQAVLTSFMFMQPSVLLSGYAFPIENMPPVIQWITYLNPMRYFITIVRGICLKGAGWSVLWPQVVPLTVFAVLFIVVASMLLKKRAD
jgi:ABC-2 type transport system permease protein